MHDEGDLLALVARDPWRMACLRAVRALRLPDAWIGAGFVRNLAWAAMFGGDDRAGADVDVVYCDQIERTAARDRALELALDASLGGVPWSVTNQARMGPHASTESAIAAWPETATAVAVRVDEQDRVHLLAPHGLGDLFAGVVRATPAFRERAEDFAARARAKRWTERFPGVRLL